VQEFDSRSRIDDLKIAIEILEAEIRFLKEKSDETFTAQEEQFYIDLVAQSEKDIEAGRVISHEDFLKKVEKW